MARFIFTCIQTHTHTPCFCLKIKKGRKFRKKECKNLINLNVTDTHRNIRSLQHFLKIAWYFNMHHQLFWFFFLTIILLFILETANLFHHQMEGMWIRIKVVELYSILLCTQQNFNTKANSRLNWIVPWQIQHYQFVKNWNHHQ